MSDISLPNRWNNALSILILICLFAPLYLIRVYTFPWPINTDEATLIAVTRTITASSPTNNIFGISYYYGSPAFIFYVFGWLEHALGGIDFYHARLVHAFFGLTTIILSYIFFRFLANPFTALVASIILGINHAFLTISRMALRDNSAIFVELLAFIFLFLSYRTKKLYFAALAGVCAALGFYVYYPGRIIIFLLLLSLGVLGAATRVKEKRIDLIKISLASFFGFIICVIPMMIATVKHIDLTYYQRQQFLLFPEGRQLAKEWFATATASDAIKKNIINGLTTFNNTINDNGYIYNNFGHGFVDKVSGILFLLGFMILLVKKQKSAEETIILTSFLTLWFIFSAMITKAPIYTRLFIILPFFAYAVVTAITHFARTATKNVILQRAMMCIFLMLIITANMFILRDYWMQGYTQGDELGGTARYIIEQDAHNEPRAFYIITDNNHPYFSMTGASIWQITWLQSFHDPHRKITLLDPNDLFLITQPSALLMSQAMWTEIRPQLQNNYQIRVTKPLIPDGRIIAVEIGN